MKKDEVIAQFKREMCRFHGYDENLNFVGTAKAPLHRWRARLFWNHAIF
jgi:hypothetical protein